jgi:demethylmenaquinone methyltransferase/2-methoxy-6-polyprenyl-1,4-benzoquinol methylase
MPDPLAVNSMFGRIAHRYDLVNRVLSGGIDLYWRSCLVSAVRRSLPNEVLDLATGSGDVALALARGLPIGTHIVGMDFCEPMLREAEAKRARQSLDRVEFRHGDALDLPLPDGSFDTVTIAFGLRNMADRARCLSEIRRVLRSRGRLFVLEFSQPTPWFRPLYSFHMKAIAPRVAGFLTGDRGAYDYLRESIEAFPDRNALSREILGAGFSKVSAVPMTLGIVALHTAER